MRLRREGTNRRRKGGQGAAPAASGGGRVALTSHSELEMRRPGGRGARRIVIIDGEAPGYSAGERLSG